MHLKIFAIDGRVVRSHCCEGEDGSVIRKGTADDGAALAQGQYFVVATGDDGTRAVERVVLLE